jgi:hypothetical protein
VHFNFGQTCKSAPKIAQNEEIQYFGGPFVILKVNYLRIGKIPARAC